MMSCPLYSNLAYVASLTLTLNDKLLAECKSNMTSLVLLYIATHLDNIDAYYLSNIPLLAA